MGFGRSTPTSTSIVADLIYDQVLAEMYTDTEMRSTARSRRAAKRATSTRRWESWAKAHRPRMGGLELVRMVHDRHPGIPVVFVSGYPLELDEEKRQYPRVICAFLPEPFTPKVLQKLCGSV